MKVEQYLCSLCPSLLCHTLLMSRFLLLHAKHSTINACLSVVCSHLCVYTASDVSTCTVDGFNITETDT